MRYNHRMTKRQQICLMILYGIDSVLKRAHNILMEMKDKLEQKTNMAYYDMRDDEDEHNEIR